jgi:hypothetical protein
VKNPFLVLSFFLFLGNPLMMQAQREVTQQNLYWVRIFAQKKINEHWSVQAEADERRLIPSHQHQQFITHWRLHHRFNEKMDAGAGLTFSTVNGLSEYRGVVEATHRWRINNKKWIFSNRIRLDMRYMQQPTDDWRWRVRVRWRPQLDLPLAKTWKLRLNSEWMYHTDAFDQSRFYAAIDHRFNQHFSFEIGYLHIYQLRSQNRYFDRDIVRSTFAFAW